LERREGDLAEIARARKPVGDDSVGDFAGHLGHAGADGGEEDARRAELVWTRREQWRHQRVRVELALEVEGRSVVPRRPHRAQRENELAHARRRLRPRRAEATLDVPTILRAEAHYHASA